MSHHTAKVRIGSSSHLLVQQCRSVRVVPQHFRAEQDFFAGIGHGLPLLQGESPRDCVGIALNQCGRRPQHLRTNIRRGAAPRGLRSCCHVDGSIHGFGIRYNKVPDHDAGRGVQDLVYGSGSHLMGADE